MDRGMLDHRPSSSFTATRPPIIHGHVFRTTRNRDSTDELSRWIVQAATLINCPAGFHFPAVRAKVPNAWIDANLAMDDLKGEGVEKRSYVTWREAVEAFELFLKTHRTPIDDPEPVLLRAMRHQEAEGGVLLLLEDSSACSRNSAGMLYLDPTWLIEVIKRLADHNLVDAANEGTVKRELEEYGEQHDPRLDLDMLWAQHRQDINRLALGRKFSYNYLFCVRVVPIVVLLLPGHLWFVGGLWHPYTTTMYLIHTKTSVSSIEPVAGNTVFWYT